MKIAIVGEGPVGLTLLSYLLYHTTDKRINDLEIYLIHKRLNNFTRRHIVSIDRGVITEIEKILNECEECLSEGLREHEKLDTSILCLENILYQKRYSKIEEINTENFNYTEYDHIFLTDGFKSPNRKKLIYDNIDYKGLSSDLGKIIFIYYFNIPNLTELPSPDSEHTIRHIHDCNNEGVKVNMDQTFLTEKGLNYDYTIALVSILYRYNLFMNRKNLWIDGFSSFKNFKATLLGSFENLTGFFSGNQTMEVLSRFKDTLSSKELYMNRYETDLLDNSELFKSHLFSYIKFVENLIHDMNPSVEGGTEVGDKPFMIHSVLSSIKINALTYNESDNLEIKFSIDKDGHKIYLLGDSAIGYSPGYSLGFGLGNIFTFMPSFLNLHFADRMEPLPNIFITNELKTFVDNNTLNLNFKGGYVSGDPKNKNIKSLEVIQREFSSLYSVDFSNVEEFCNIYNVMNIINMYKAFDSTSEDPDITIPTIGSSPLFRPPNDPSLSPARTSASIDAVGGNKRRKTKKTKKKITKRRNKLYKRRNKTKRNKTKRNKTKYKY